MIFKEYLLMLFAGYKEIIMIKSTDIGEKIRALRIAKNFSREYFAELIGISVSHLEKIETGDRRPGIGTF